jgi:hypothetical protein
MLDLLVAQALLVHREVRDLQVVLDQLAHRAVLDLQVQQALLAHREVRDLQVVLDQLAHRAILVLLEVLVIQVAGVLMVLLLQLQ